MRAPRVVLGVVIVEIVVAIGGLVAIVGGAGCLRQTDYHCTASTQCELAGVAGRCEADGFCSTADTTCSSGFRYVDGAPAAGTCVGAGAAVNECLVQAKLAVDTSTCTRDVCAVDARCCDREWSETCVHEAETVCGKRCSTLLASIGPALVKVQRWDGATFAPVWSHALGADTGYSALAWGDLDGDLDPDLAFCEPQANLQIWRQGGDCGDVFCKVAEAGPVPDCATLRWVDLDGDGDLDVAAGGAYRGFAWLNDDGVWAPTVIDAFGMGITSSLAWADLDGDGDLDIAHGQYDGTLLVETLQPAGAQVLPTFTTVWTDPTVDRWESVAWGDIDRDGKLDLLTSGDAFVHVYLNTLTDGFEAAATHYVDLATVDFNDIHFLDADEDGDLDLVGAADGDHAVVFRNNLIGGGNHTVTATPIWTAATTPNATHLAIGDVDGDGHEDLFLAAAPDVNRTDRSALFLKQGATAAWGTGANQPQWTDPDPRVIYDVAFAPETP